MEASVSARATPLPQPCPPVSRKLHTSVCELLLLRVSRGGGEGSEGAGERGEEVGEGKVVRKEGRGKGDRGREGEERLGKRKGRKKGERR